MTGPEFFMKYAGWKLLPEEFRTGDAVADAADLFTRQLPHIKGSTQRFSSIWMVVTPRWVATSFKVTAAAAFRTDLKKPDAIHMALKEETACLYLDLGKRTLKPADLFVTYDPRALRKCSQGKTKTTDHTKEKSWTS